MPNYHCPLQPDGVYHIFNRANGNEQLFTCADNYRYFIHKYRQHSSPVAQTLAWCLLPNHFHCLIKVRPEAALEQHYRNVKKDKHYYPSLLPDFVMERFANGLNAYTKAFNKMYGRSGSLFTDYLRRVEIMNDRQFAATVFYVHKNAVHHGLCRNINDWHWYSYKEYMQQQYRIVSPDVVLQFFGGTAAFAAFHQQPVHVKEAVVLE